MRLWPGFYRQGHNYCTKQITIHITALSLMCLSTGTLNIVHTKPMLEKTGI